MPSIIDLSAKGGPASGGKKSNNRKNIAGGAGAVGVARNVGNANVETRNCASLPVDKRLFNFSTSRPRPIVIASPAAGGTKQSFRLRLLRSFHSLAMTGKWFIPAGIIVAVIVIGLSFILFKKDAQPTQAAWFSDEWHYRQQFDVFNASTTEDLIDFQVPLATSTLALRTAWTAGKLKNDFSDLRFTDSQGNVLDFWYPDATSTMRDVYIKMPTMPKNATSTVMMYYGNPSASDKRDGNKVFPDFFEDFSDNTYAAGSRFWTVQSGTYTVTGSPDKYLNNTGAGVISTPLTKANGIWEFNLYKAADGNASNVYFMDAGTTTGGAGYNFQFNSSEAAVLNETGVGDLFASANSYIANAAWYKVKITRSPGGVFTTYVNGTLVTANSGSNPVTDTTTNASSYFVLDLDASDRIDNILWRKFAATDPRLVATAGTSEETGGGPVGYWSFDEGYGTTAYDRSGSGNNGTLTNMTTTGTSTAWTTGKMGKALQFDGVNDYVNVGNVNKTVNSVSFWLNANNLTKDIIDFDGGTHYITASAGTLSATGFTSPTIYVDGKVSSKIKLNIWHYITVTTATGFTASNLKLGLKTSYWQGVLDEVKIYNYVISSAQILAEYNRGASAKLSISPSSEQDLYQGLIGYWPMDEATTVWDGTGDRVNDYSGLGNNGTASGNAHATSTAVYGNAAEFDGTDDFVTLPAAATVAGLSKVTINAWVKLRSLAQTSCIYCSQTSTAGNDRLGLYVDTNGKVNLVYRDLSQDPAGAATTITGNTALAVNTWYFISAVYDADTDKQTIYINGFQDKQTSNVVANFGGSTANAIKIGDNNGSNEINGLIDDLKLYSLARAPDQITQDYLQGPKPVIYYDFEEGRGTSLSDKSGVGNNSSSFNGGLGASKNDWTLGKKGRALKLDGVNDYVNAGRNSSLDFGAGAFSVSLWFKPKKSNAIQIIVGKGTNSASGWFLSMDKRYNSNQRSVGFSVNSLDDNGKYIYRTSTAASPALNVWNYLAGVWDKKNNLIRIYLNGVEVATSISQNIGTESQIGNSNKTTKDALLGAYDDGSLLFFDGQIDEFKMYNYALTPWQIAREYNNGNPIAQWGLDEGRGTNAYNTYATSTNALSGALTNMSTTGTSTAWTAGKFGQALLFDGTNDTVAVTDGADSALDMVGAGSLSAWVKPTSVSGNKYIIDKVESTQYALLLSGANVKGYFGNSSCSGGTAKANEWSYVSVAWDGAYIRCYLNGAEVAKTAYSTALTPHNTSLYIGSDGGAASWFSGIIDEPKVYQYALSPTQVKKDYNDGLAVALSTADGGQNSQNGLVGWWRMDESTTVWDGTGDRVNDYSGLGNHGTASGDAHATTTAVYGNAGNFDGTNDYVTVPAGATLAGKTQATISAWVYADDFGVTSCVYCEQTSTAGNDRLGLYVNTSGKITLTYRDSTQDPAGTAITLTGNTTLSAATWYYVTAVYDADTDRQIIYLNGVEDKKATAAISGFGTSAASAIRIADLNGDNEWDGLIDDVKIYNLARTPDQIMQDYLVGPGPIASYNFEEKSGTTVNDISGQGNNGTITAGSSKGFVKGKIGRSYDFDGTPTSGDTLINTGSNWIGTGNISVSAWIYAESYGETRGFIISNGKFGLIVDSTNCSGTVNTLLFSSNDSTGVCSAANSILLNRWYHVVLTRSSATTNNTNFYINGVLSGTANQSSGAPTAGINNVLIGNYTLAASRTFDGRIDDLKVYNYVLTPWQIAQEYNGGGPVGYWKMDEGENKTVYDWSGKGNNGTLSLSGSPATSTAWQAEANCKKGKCLDFDGTNDYVNIGDVSAFDTTFTQFGASVWVKPDSGFSESKFVIGKMGLAGQRGWQLHVDSDYKVTITYFDGPSGSSQALSTTKPISANQWTHLTFTFSASSALKIYINGVLSAYANSGVLTQLNGSNSSGLQIGSRGDGIQFFPGLIDEVKIYNYAPSPAQIREEYNGGFGTYFK